VTHQQGEKQEVHHNRCGQARIPALGLGKAKVGYDRRSRKCLGDT
jgi:hypothetical protein